MYFKSGVFGSQMKYLHHIQDLKHFPTSTFEQWFVIPEANVQFNLEHVCVWLRCTSPANMAVRNGNQQHTGKFAVS